MLHHYCEPAKIRLSSLILVYPLALAVLFLALTVLLAYLLALAVLLAYLLALAVLLVYVLALSTSVLFDAKSTHKTNCS